MTHPHPYYLPGLAVKKCDISSQVIELLEPECMNQKRNRHLVYQRYAAVCLMSKFSTLSCTRIGLLLGLDHATVLYARKQAENALQGYNKELLDYILQLTSKLKTKGVI